MHCEKLINIHSFKAKKSSTRNFSLISFIIIQHLISILFFASKHTMCGLIQTQNEITTSCSHSVTSRIPFPNCFLRLPKNSAVCFHFIAIVASEFFHRNDYDEINHVMVAVFCWLYDRFADVFLEERQIHSHFGDNCM